MRQFIRKYEKELAELKTDNDDAERRLLVELFLTYWQLAFEELQLKNAIGKRVDKNPNDVELEKLYGLRVEQQGQHHRVMGVLAFGKVKIGVAVS